MKNIGIDLGGTNIAIGIVNEDYTILKKGSVPTNSKRPWQEIIKDMATLAQKLMEETGTTLDEIKEIGVGSPGTPDVDTGVLLYTNNLGWDHVPVREELQKYINKPVYLDNDANSAALGEFLAGAARGLDSAVILTFGTGIGGGIILDDHIWSGFNYAGGEIGHTVIQTGGYPCTCGRNGCWESYASMTGVIRQGNDAADAHPESELAKLRASGTKLNGRNIFEVAKAGDEVAQQVVDQFIFYIAEGVVNVINIFQPEAVVIGGAIANEGDYVLEPLRKYAKRDVFCKHVELPPIIRAKLGNDAGIIGAAFLGDYQSKKM
nr:ROK family protein [uncultured Solibaculum sp.]